MNIRIRIRFYYGCQMDASESDFENFSLSDFIFVFEEYPITTVSIRIRKEKVTSETILNLSLYLIT